MENLTKVILASAVMVVTLCGNAAAESWLCSISQAVAVHEDGTVGEPDLGPLERPTFLRVDVDNKKITLLAPASRRGEVTQIDTINERAGFWMFSGMEEGRAWSMVLSKQGHMTLSITGDGAAWSVFGHAILEKLVEGKIEK